MRNLHIAPSRHDERESPDPIVERAARGDREALGDLFMRNAPWIYGQLSRMLGPGADLEDMVQEVFLRAFRSLRKYRAEGHFLSWLRKITANVAYDQMRSRRNRVRLVLVDGDLPGSSEPDMDHKEAVRHLMRLIDTLPPRNRLVLLLHDVEGYTGEEIRTIVGVRSVNTVRSRLRLARAELDRRAKAHPALRDLQRRRKE